MADIPEGKNPETWRPYRAPGELYKGPRREFDSVPLGDLLGRGGHGGQKRAYKRRERVRAIPECEAAVRWEAARIKMYLRAKSRMLAQDQPERWRMGCGPLTEERHEVLCFLLDRIGANRKVCISHGCVADGTDRGVNTVKRAIAVGEMLLGEALTVYRQEDMPREVRTGYLTGNRACVYVFRVPKDLDAVLAEWERRRALKWTQWRLAGRQHTPRNRKAQGGRVSNSLFKKRNQQKRSAAQEGVPGGEGGPDRDDSRPAPEAAESRPVKGGDKQREEFTPERRAEDLRAAKAWLKAGKARKAPLHAIMEGIARWYPSALAKMAQGSPARQAWAEDWRWKWGHLLE